MKTLYQVDNKGQLREWSIWHEFAYDYAYILIQHGLKNGLKQTDREDIHEGKAGRTLMQQVESRVSSRINKQLAKGYRHTIGEAEANKGKNELNLFKPMLAQQINKQKSYETDGAVLQRKLDGNRMLATKQNGEILAYTRNGKPIETLGHITEQLGWLEEGMTVDGEVYTHGMALKDINSNMRREQATTKDLKYHIYDVVADDSFKTRFEVVTNTYNTHGPLSAINIEPFWYYKDKTETANLFNEARREGYEGLILRPDNFGYAPGKRSKGLLKIKYRYDGEYKVIGIERGKYDYGILILELPDGKVVRGMAPGARLEKLHVGMNPDLYIGKMCTCSYAYLTAFGIPFHLTCDRWR